MNVAPSLKTYRKEKALTQKEMASRLSVTREYYGRLEKGIGRPSLDLLERICSSTGIPVERLVKGTDDALAWKDVGNMCEFCLALPHDDQKEIMRLMKRMLKK